jgi:dethiobiotin synthase
VGKTTVSAALLCRYRGQFPVRYWKPIQTGIELDDDTASVVRLGGCHPDEVLTEGIRLARPVSPHLAAAQSGCTIALPPLLDLVRRQSRRWRWIVEGAGGVLVPINERETMADLVIQLGLPALVVARTAVGTINHTLLTLEALRARSIDVAGVVMVGSPDVEARATVERRGRVVVVGDMPTFDPLTSADLAAWAALFDPVEYLARWLT